MIINTKVTFKPKMNYTSHLKNQIKPKYKLYYKNIVHYYLRIRSVFNMVIKVTPVSAKTAQAIFA